MTDKLPDILQHFADIACALNQIDRSADVITGEPASSLPDTAEDLAELLDCRGGWRNIEDALRELEVSLRALARPDVGLPEGWRIGQPVTYPDGTQHTATAPDGGCVSLVVEPGGVRWFGIAAPPAVLFALLRAAGVAP